MSYVTPLDVRDAKIWIEAKWGHQKSWESWEDHAGEYAGFTVGALKESLRTWYRRGSGKAPMPDQLRKLVAEIQLLRVERGIDEVERICGGEHVWADPGPLDDDRHRVCVLCGETGAISECDPHHFNRHGRCVYCLERAG